MKETLTSNNVDQYRIINLSDIKIKQKLLFDFLEKRKEKTEFEEPDSAKRVYPQISYDKAKSIISIFLPYLSLGHDFSGNISVYAQAEDYHIWGKNKLEKIVKELKTKYPSNDFYHQMDKGPLNERFFAYISGLGKKGINSMIINEKYGSYGFIGLIITDIEINPYMSEISECSKCMICKTECPGQAIKGDFTIDAKLCASYISQTKKELNEVQLNILKSSGKIFGCDICQMYCPDNKNKENIDYNDNFISKLEYNDLENISNREFKKYFGEKAFSWRGKGILLRNLDIIEDN